MASAEYDKSQWHELTEYKKYYPVIKGYERGGREFVDILGVELERAEFIDYKYVPRLSEYKDIVLDNDFQAILQEVAIAFKLGLPILIESGTSLGKTTAVKFLCALCGYECHYVALSGNADINTYMGTMGSNTGTDEMIYDFGSHELVPNLGPDQVRFIFYPGSVTLGLIPEQGKVKVILLDELNAAKPNVNIRLHEVLDSIKRNSTITLTEVQNRTLAVDNNVTKLVALQNQPGDGYQGRNPIDPALLRRWIFQHNGDSLSQESKKQIDRSKAGFKDPIAKSSKALPLESQIHPLSVEEMVANIPGWELITKQISAFRDDMQEKIKLGRIGKDQKQKISFDDREEYDRVISFILQFYNGDITEVTQNALRYIFRNKLQSEKDRQIVEEAIKLVEYRPTTGESKRVPLFGKAPIQAKTPPNRMVQNNSEKTSGEALKNQIVLPNQVNQPKSPITQPTSPIVAPNSSPKTGRTIAEIEQTEKAEAERKELDSLVAKWVSDVSDFAAAINEITDGIVNKGYKDISKSQAENDLRIGRDLLQTNMGLGPLAAKWKPKLSQAHHDQINVATTKALKAIDDLAQQISKTKEITGFDF